MWNYPRNEPLYFGTRIFAWISPCVSVYPFKATNRSLCFWVSLSSNSCNPLMWYYTGLRQSLLSPLYRRSGLVAAFQLPPAAFLQVTLVLPRTFNRVYSSWRQMGKIAVLYRWDLSCASSLLKAHLAFLSYQGPLTLTITHFFKLPLLTGYNLMLIYPSVSNLVSYFISSLCFQSYLIITISTVKWNSKKYYTFMWCTFL